MSEFVDTDDLRIGPPLHPALRPYLPLIGSWRGTGRGGYPTIEDFDYGQQLRFSHDGRPLLRYESRSWIIGPDGDMVRLAAAELGWWRPVEAGFEALLSYSVGVTEIYTGTVNTATQWEMSTDIVARTQTAKEVTANHRLYGIVDGALLYAIDMAAVGQPLTPHLSARLARVAG